MQPVEPYSRHTRQDKWVVIGGIVAMSLATAIVVKERLSSPQSVLGVRFGIFPNLTPIPRQEPRYSAPTTQNAPPPTDTEQSYASSLAPEPQTRPAEPRKRQAGEFQWGDVLACEKQLQEQYSATSFLPDSDWALSQARLDMEEFARGQGWRNPATGAADFSAPLEALRAQNDPQYVEAQKRLTPDSPEVQRYGYSQQPIQKFALQGYVCWKAGWRP